MNLSHRTTDARSLASDLRHWWDEVFARVATWVDGRVSYLERQARRMRKGDHVENAAEVSAPTGPWPDRLHWWIDSVGSYLVCTRPTVHIGQAGDRSNDVTILGDLSARHADLLVGPTGVVLVARSETKVNGVAGESFLLKDGDRIAMRSVELIYLRPNPLSTTSVLKIASRHRLPMSMDGIVLLGETATVGPGTGAIVRTPWDRPLHLNWFQNSYWVKGPAGLRIDGRDVEGGYGKLRPDSRIDGDWGSFRWEIASR